MSDSFLTGKSDGESIGKVGPMRQVLPTEKTSDLKDSMSKVKKVAGGGLDQHGAVQGPGTLKTGSGR